MTAVQQVVLLTECIFYYTNSAEQTGQLHVKEWNWNIQKKKKNLEWIKDLNIRLHTIKLLEKNTGWILFNTNHSDIFVGPSPELKGRKVKINKLDLMKQKPLHIIGKLTKNEKTTYLMAENICKWYDLWRIKIQHI